MRPILAAALLCASAAFADAAAGISWKMPESWKADPPRPMRAATYKVAPAKGDSEEAECGVFFFGAGQGGSVQANVDRWVGQFEGAKAPEQKKEKIAGFEVTTIELEGTYAQASMMAPNAPKTPHPGYKLVGVIVEAPQGPVFFKLTGPKKTVDAAKPDLTKMIKLLTKT